MPALRLTEAEFAAANDGLVGLSPPEILRWAVRQFHPKLLMATAFGVEGCCLIHMLADIEPRVRLVNLDTGYQFPETMRVRDRIRERYGLEVELIQPDSTVAEYEKLHGGPLYLFQPDQCCHDRKIVPLTRVLAGQEAWISSIRKEQSSVRAVAKPVQWDRKFGLFKVNPLLGWTHKDVWNFVHEHDVPYNELHDRNYPSIGCAPCTRAVAPGEDERAGRWSGSDKKECGLHLMPEQEQGSGI